jgi:glycosyltransferase involved in cell wall biosynthesis
MRIAILHHWFLMKGGAERVVDVMAEMFPDADIFALFVDPARLSETLKGRRVFASKLNKVPWSSKLFRQLMPLYPWAVESIDLSQYDLIISSCSASMMGAAVSQDAVHICYCHTPERLWWDMYAEYQARLSGIPRALYVMGASYNRLFEFSAIQRVDEVVANSIFIQKRIAKYFRRTSTVIYPPVDVERGFLGENHEDYYLYLGRLGRPKRINLIIEACNKLKRRLLISGVGPDEAELRSIAGPTIEFLGHVPDEQVGPLFASCRAFLFGAIEDFGMAPVEAQSYGRPVIAYGYGGSLETVRVDDPGGRPDTGVFFARQDVDSVVEAILRFELNENRFVPEEIQKHARQFDKQTFMDRFGGFVNSVLETKGISPVYKVGPS